MAEVPMSEREPLPLERTSLRVPSVVPGKWVYLRTWSIWLQGDGTYAGYRSNGSEIWNIRATTTEAVLVAAGLEPVRFADRGSFTANAQALDDYLLSLGAEPAPEKDDEWAPGCSGTVPNPELERTRTPFRPDDWDAADVEMKARGHKSVIDREPKKVL
jgi:hypothetical protein